MARTPGPPICCHASWASGDLPLAHSYFFHKDPMSDFWIAFQKSASDRWPSFRPVMASCVSWCSFNLLEVKEKAASEPSSSFFFVSYCLLQGFLLGLLSGLVPAAFLLASLLPLFLPLLPLAPGLQAFSLVCCLFLNLLLRFSIALGGVFLASLSRFLAFFQAFCMGFLFRCACSDSPLPLVVSSWPASVAFWPSFRPFAWVSSSGVLVSAWLPCKLLLEAAGFFRDPMF